MPPHGDTSLSNIILSSPESVTEHQCLVVHGMDLWLSSHYTRPFTHFKVCMYNYDPIFNNNFLFTMKLKDRYGLNHSQEPNTVLRSYLHLRFRLEIIVVCITTTKRSCRLHKYDTIGTVYAHYGLWNLDLSTHTYLPPWRVHFEAARLFFYSSSLL